MLQALKKVTAAHLGALRKDEAQLSTQRRKLAEEIAKAQRAADVARVNYEAERAVSGMSSPVPAQIAKLHAVVQSAEDRVAKLTTELEQIDVEIGAISRKTGAPTAVLECQRAIQRLDAKAEENNSRASALDQRVLGLRDQEADRLAKADELRSAASRAAADGEALSVPTELARIEHEASIAAHAAAMAEAEARRLRDEAAELQEEASSQRRYELRQLVEAEAELEVEAAVANLMPLLARLAAARRTKAVEISIPAELIEKAERDIFG